MQLQDKVKIFHLNQQLSLVEEEISLLAQEQDKIAQEKLGSNKAMVDYELQVNIFIYASHEEENLVSWSEYFKNIDKRHNNINDKENHNVTSCCWKDSELNSQQHCWILHRLYDDFDISWKDIINVTKISFDIEISYQYSMDITSHN